MRTRSTRIVPIPSITITLWLPNEVITEIFLHLPRADQLTLCRVSKLFHGLVLPILLQKVVLSPKWSNSSTLKAFCTALIENPARTDSVRSLTFINRAPYYAVAEDFLIQTLKLLRRLKHIWIEDRRIRGVVSHLSSLTFPDLSSCFFPRADYNDTRKRDVAQFLGRHPTITQLHLWDRPDTDIPQSILLPKLLYYNGSLHLLRCVSTDNLVVVQTTWTTQSPIFVQILGAQTGHDFSLCIECPLVEKVAQVLVQLSTHMPRLQKLRLTGLNPRHQDYTVSLQFRCPYNFNSNPTTTMSETLNQITKCLPRFERLAYLALALHHTARLPSTAKVDEALRSWADSCPTLRGGCIGKKAWMDVGDQWEACSREEFDTEAGFVLWDRIFGSGE
ncbi:hypothetical protein FB45DRAFT_931373 [Roridomyces roridus]|uniref:F-box domain-containing protein n=1 Tax=Roridomyces roridus TaxID=1738132 RepID=A0AAD7BGD3_9AGAR|nr:hypothetical protein FB45DRAFT_931373 [Roridomyces roridus]